MTAGALVLNADYRAICVVPLRRAVVLVLTGKADLVETRPGAIRSAGLAVEVPSVVRLSTFVAVPFRRRVPVTRRAVLIRDGYECCYCGERATTIDHVVPKARGGRHRWLNVVAACAPCNSRKADRTVAEAGLAMRYTPCEPEGAVGLLAVVGRASVEPEWAQWLPAVA